MLLTVQDIPDIGKTASNSQQQNRKSAKGAAAAASTASNSTKNQRSQLHLHIPHQAQRQQQQPLYGSTNTVKRSQSSISQDESNCSTISRSTVHTAGHTRDRVCGDFYDTASTATTLTPTITPTPSESGRITPFQQQQQQPIYTRATPTNNSKLTQQAIEQRERELIMDLQNQSFDYSQPLRTGSSASAASQNHPHNSKVNNKVGTLSATSEDDESIPYHAREDSRPFTYGDATGVQLSPTSARKQGMIKLQAGLSSPSLVRKHLGANHSNAAPASARKSPNTGRNDFEEMLLQRREKILNDKYSIGDKTPNGNSASHAVNANTKWINNNHSSSSNTLNGYQYHEPLKRSNTMDGGFGRGNTSGYVSDG